MEYGWSIRLACLAPASLIAACVAAPPAQEATPSIQARAAQSAAPAIDWHGGDCVSLLRRLQQAASKGRLTADDRPPFAVQVVAAPGGWLDAVPPLPIEADLPLAIDDAAQGGGAPCVLRIGPPRDQDAAHRVVDVQDVRSAYQSSVRSERNPDYDTAQQALRNAKDGAGDGPSVIRVGDPLLDLIGTTVGGLLGGIDDSVRQHAIDDAAAELAATPRSLDRPTYRPYSFERVVVRAEKQAVVPVALLDAGGRELRATELRQSERRELFVLRGLDPRDRDYEQHRSSSMTEASLARWARTPPALRLSSVAVALIEDAPAVAPLAGIAPAAGPPRAGPVSIGLEEPRDIRLDLPPSPHPAAATAPADPWRAGAADAARADAHAPSVVTIRAGRAAGHGFYVRDDLVLTTARLVGHISVVDVTTAEGATVPALVAALDPTHDLALLQVPRPGPAAALDEGSLPAPISVSGDDAPGLPVLADDRVVGMTAGAGMVPVAAIHAFLEDHAALLAAIP